MFSVIAFFHLLERQKQISKDLLTVASLHKCRNSRGSVRPKADVCNSIQLSQGGGRDPSTRAITRCFPECMLAESWDEVMKWDLRLGPAVRCGCPQHHLYGCAKRQPVEEVKFQASLGDLSRDNSIKNGEKRDGENGLGRRQISGKNVCYLRER